MEGAGWREQDGDREGGRDRGREGEREGGREGGREKEGWGGERETRTYTQASTRTARSGSDGAVVSGLVDTAWNNKQGRVRRSGKKSSADPTTCPL